LIGYILLKKFPQVANLDVYSLPSEKEAQKKREIINKRVEEESKKMEKTWKERLSPLRKLWGGIQLKFRIYVGKVEKLWYHEHAKKIIEPTQPLTKEEKEQRLRALLQEAEDCLKQEKFDQAEGLYIAAIKMNEHSQEAYRGLADTYLIQGSYEEARQTYKFLLQLHPQDDSILVKLGDIAELQGRYDEAIDYYQQAVIANDSLSPRFYHLAELLLKVKQPQIAQEAMVAALDLEPRSPKYLDLSTEIAIICGDKPQALKYYKELRMVNPDNQKLEEFKNRIYQM
jgi:tetratricopeptide (TPR) repeat protein